MAHLKFILDKMEKTTSYYTYSGRETQPPCNQGNLLKGIKTVGWHLNPGLFNPKLQPRTFQPQTFQPLTFQPQTFQPWIFEPWGWKVHRWKVWGWKVRVEMSFNLLERWHFNPGLFNPSLFNHYLFNPMVQKKLGVEKSGVEMPFDRLQSCSNLDLFCWPLEGPEFHIQIKNCRKKVIKEVCSIFQIFVLTVKFDWAVQESAPLCNEKQIEMAILSSTQLRAHVQICLLRNADLCNSLC